MYQISLENGSCAYSSKLKSLVQQIWLFQAFLDSNGEFKYIDNKLSKQVKAYAIPLTLLNHPRLLSTSSVAICILLWCRHVVWRNKSTEDWQEALCLLVKLKCSKTASLVGCSIISLLFLYCYEDSLKGRDLFNGTGIAWFLLIQVVMVY